MPFKKREEYQSDCPEYKAIANSVNFAMKQLREQRKKKTTTRSMKQNIIKKLHTLMVTKWIAGKRFGIQSASIVKELKSYRRAAHTNIVDELFFLKHYRYSASDLYKYEQEFKEELNYGMAIV